MMLAFMAQFASPQTAGSGEYMGKIGAEYKLIQMEMWDYTNAASHGKSAKTVEKKREALVTTTYGAKNRVSRMKDFEGNTAYRDSVAAFLNIYYLVLKEDYAKIVDMEEIAERSYDAMEAYMMAKEGANNKLSEASDMLQREQNKFAEEYGVEIMDVDDDLSIKMKMANEVYVYYNELYLIFFKSYVSDLYLAEAISKGDVNAIEQNKSALSTATAEGLEKVKEIQAFKDDKTLLGACVKMLEFYQREADVLIDDVTNYFIKSENFKTIKTSFDQKKDGDKTQADIDQFNNAVNESNAAGQKYNAATQEISQSRSGHLDNWNKTVDRFIDRHVPRGKVK